MDVVRFLAGTFFIIWSIVGIVALIGSIMFIGFMASASSFLESSPLGMLAGQGEFPMEGAEQIKTPGGENAPSRIAGIDTRCALRILGEQRSREILSGQTPTPQEQEQLQQCVTK